MNPRNARQIRERPSPLPKPIIEGILNEGDLVILTGQYDSFKTTMSLELAHAVNTGEPFLGMFRVVKAGPTYMYQQEVHPGAFDDRVNQLNINSSNQDTFWVDYSPIVLDGAGYRDIDTVIAVHKPLLVSFDPLSNFWPPNMEENSNKAVTYTLKPMLASRIKTGTCFMLAHGDAKAGAEGQVVRARGASDLLYKPDVRIFLDRADDEDINKIKVTVRTRNLIRIPPFYANYLPAHRRLMHEKALLLPEAPMQKKAGRPFVISTEAPHRGRKHG